MCPLRTTPDLYQGCAGGRGAVTGAQGTGGGHWAEGVGQARQAALCPCGTMAQVRPHFSFLESDPWGW